MLLSRRLFSTATRNRKGVATSVYDYNLKELEDKFSELGLEKFRSRQVWDWVYKKGVTSYDDMKNVPASARDILRDTLPLRTGSMAQELVSTDGTRKWLTGFPEGNSVETVFIPESTRGTVCISSQVGCSLSCSFCHTGTQPLSRNLVCGEIVEQVVMARRQLQDFSSTPNRRNICSNVVLMGQGEPLYNYRQVSRAIRILMDPAGLALPKHRITLSTSGVVPLIAKLRRDLDVNLAISLHAPYNDLRSEIMGINRTYPLPSLIEACRQYVADDPTELQGGGGGGDSQQQQQQQQQRGGQQQGTRRRTSSSSSSSSSSKRRYRTRRITFEYVMLRGVNDSPDHARALARLLHGIPALVNLIPFNAWPGSNYVCSEPSVIEDFRTDLRGRGLNATVRVSRGDDILAACGQLNSLHQSEKKQQRGLAGGGGGGGGEGGCSQ